MVTLRRDFDPKARFRTEGVEERRRAVLADVLDYETLLRVLNEHEVSAAFHLAAQTLVGAANCSRGLAATWAWYERHLGGA